MNFPPSYYIISDKLSMYRLYFCYFNYFVIPFMCKYTKLFHKVSLISEIVDFDFLSCYTARKKHSQVYYGQ